MNASQVDPLTDTNSSVFADIQRLHLIMGLQCNARCTFCYQKDWSQRYNMAEHLYRDQLKSLYPHVVDVKLQGGEPTIMKNCREFVSIAKDYPQMKLGIVTNGVVMDDLWKEALIHQGRSVSVSINAASEEVYKKVVVGGKWKLVMRNLEWLVENRQEGTPQLSISTVVVGNNFHELPEFIRMGGRLGIDQVIICVDPILTPRTLPDSDEVERVLNEAAEAAWESNCSFEGLNLFIKMMKLDIEAPAEPCRTGDRCPLPFNNVVVDHDGAVRVCCQTWKTLGNLNDHTIEELLDCDMLREFRERISNNDYRWCPANCPENRNPRRTALLDKYAHMASKDPQEFIKKVGRKIKTIVKNK